MTPTTLEALEALPEGLQQLLCNPQIIEKVLSEDHLEDFVETFWPCVDGAPFQACWVISAVCEHVQAVLDGQIKRLLMTIPPRHTKSTCVSVMAPAWTWQRKNPTGLPLLGPSVQFLCLSYGQDLSYRDSRKCRRVIESEQYQEWFGDRFRMTGDENEVKKFQNDKHGYRRATSVTGALTGDGGDVILIDDPHNVIDIGSEAKRIEALECFNESLPTRLNSADDGAMIMIMQRLHQKDLAGRAIELGWEHLKIPFEYEGDTRKTTIGWQDPRTKTNQIAWPERWSREAADGLKKSMGSYAYSAQQQQNPIPREGGLYQRESFKIIKAAPRPSEIIAIVRRWDLAATEKSAKQMDPDFTASCKMAITKDARVVIMHMTQHRLTPGRVEKLVRQLADLDSPEVPITMEQEPGASGKSMIAHYKRHVLFGYAFRGVTSSGNKFVRMEPLASQAEDGNVYLVEGEWNEPFLSEAELIPNGGHDDMCDSASGAFTDLALSEQLQVAMEEYNAVEVHGVDLAPWDNPYG